METAQINYAAPDASFTRVGILHRLIAGIIDAIVLAVLTFVPTLLLSKIHPSLGAIVGGALGLAYYSLEVFKAQSLGKMVLKLKITKQDGSAADMDQLVKRYAFKQAPQVLMIVAAIPFLGLVSIAAMVAALAVLVSSLFMLKPEKLAFHDQFLGTAVYGPAKLTFSLPAAADLKVDRAALDAAVATAARAATPTPVTATNAA